MARLHDQTANRSILIPHREWGIVLSRDRRLALRTARWVPHNDHHRTWALTPSMAGSVVFMRIANWRTKPTVTERGVLAMNTTLKRLIPSHAILHTTETENYQNVIQVHLHGTLAAHNPHPRNLNDFPRRSRAPGLGSELFRAILNRWVPKPWDRGSHLCRLSLGMASRVPRPTSSRI